MAFQFRILILGPLLGFLPFPAALVAQEEVIPVIQGQVLSGEDPLPGAMVVLHQVSGEMSGEIDSIQAGPDGTFRLRLPRVPAHAADAEIFFASVQYRGLLYFGHAITDPVQLDSIYLIQAYDTLSVPDGGADLPLTARNVFLEKVEDGWDATDFFQIRNEGDRTLFSADEGMTWQYPLPASARDFQTGQADLAPDAVRFQAGSVALYAPIPPGERFFLVRYHIPEEDFTIPMPGRTEQMEVLIRQPAPDVEFPPLVRSTPVELEQGNVFGRFEGTGLVDSEVRARVLGGSIHFRAEWLGLILAALLGGAGVFAFRAGAPRMAKKTLPVATPTRDELILSIAELDEQFQQAGDTGDAARERYLARRRKLLKRLESSS